jgi:hypothetical protein
MGRARQPPAATGATDRRDLLGWKFSFDKIVAAAAVEAAVLPGDENLRQDLADHGCDVDPLPYWILN